MKAYSPGMRTLVIGIALSVFLLGCKSDKSEGGSEPAAAPPSTSVDQEAAGVAAEPAPGGGEDGTCQMTVEGAVTAEDRSTGKDIGIGSTYWMAEEDMEACGGPGSTTSWPTNRARSTSC